MATTNEIQMFENTRSSAKEMQEMIKGSFFLDDSLPDMLSRAPMAAQLMGMLHILASSEAATMAERMIPGEYVRHDNVPANLNALVNKGMNAFDEANRSMYTIKTSAEVHFGAGGTIMKIIATLSEPHKARHTLEPRMQMLQKDIDECANAARVALQHFDEWKYMAQELSELAFKSKDSIAKQKRAREEDAKRHRRQLEHEEQMKKDAEESVRLYKSRMEEREKDYRKAFKKAGSVRQAVGDVLLSASLNTVTAIPRAVNAAVDLPKEAIKGAANWGSFLSSGERDPYAGDKTSQSSIDTSAQASTSSQPAPPTPDMALQEAGTALQALEELREAWTNMATSGPSADGTDNPVQAALDKLLSLQGNLQQIGSRVAQQITTSVLQPAIEIGRTASDILQQEVDEEARQNLIRDWESRLQEPLNQAISLNTTASLQTGRGFGATMPLAPHVKATLQGDQAVLSPTIFMEKRARDLLTMETGMESAIRSYNEKSAALEKTQAKIVSLSLRLEELDTRQVTLEKVGQFLNEAIQSITSLQAEVRQLAEYFSCLSKDITGLVDVQCLDLINLLKAPAPDEGLVLIYGQEIFESILQVRCKFAVIHTQTIFYREVSNQYIVPALRDVCQLPIHLDREQQAIAQKRLTDSVNVAANAILQQGRDYQSRLSQSIQGVHDRVQKEITYASPELRQQLIKVKQKEGGLIKNSASRVEEVRDEGIRNSQASVMIDIDRVSDELGDL